MLQKLFHVHSNSGECSNKGPTHLYMVIYNASLVVICKNIVVENNIFVSSNLN